MIRTSRDGAVLTITLDRPEAMNALTPTMMADIADALAGFDRDDGLRVAVITGAGERAFCAGADLGVMAEGGEHYRERRLGLFGMEVAKPVIASINGHCLAGGLALALLCDVRVAADHATFGCMGTARGILPGAGQTKRLPEVVGFGNAMWLLLSAERIDAVEALRIGLVNRVVPAAQLAAATAEWAAILASRAPLAVRATKQAARRNLNLTVAEALRVEAELAAPVMASEDAKEGLRAFAEKRPPAFRGM
jgi:enoyl-CoA hydratase/carnithine racemase